MAAKCPYKQLMQERGRDAARAKAEADTLSRVPSSSVDSAVPSVDDQLQALYKVRHARHKLEARVLFRDLGHLENALHISGHYHELHKVLGTQRRTAAKRVCVSATDDCGAEIYAGRMQANFLLHDSLRRVTLKRLHSTEPSVVRDALERVAAANGRVLKEVIATTQLRRLRIRTGRLQGVL